ncbi:HTH_Tnp_Tc3_2 domain-containing protein [Trichonephila clavipes]|nr:HTH_Tnp_Tc3_2 domain-containing protein [Trichonephila clavipes]
MKFGFSRTVISRVYSDYRESDKTSNLRHRCDWKKNMEERDQRRLTRIIKRDRCVTLPQIAADFNAGPPTSINPFRWPSKSPDMHIIEYIRNALQRAVQKRSPPLLTLTDLWTALQDPWCHLPSTLLQPLIESMPRRVAALLRACGCLTRY